MSKKTYKLYCKDLEEIISVKSFRHEEELKVYESLKDSVVDSPPNFNVMMYKKKVVDLLLIDSQSYYTYLDEVPEQALLDEVTDSLYETIVEAYPHFEFEFICNDINNTIAFEQMRSLFKKHIELLGVEKSNKRGLRTIKDLNALARYLESNVIGQSEACKKSLNSLKLLVAGLDKCCSLLYIGPTGVGKTKLAKTIGEKYSGNFYKINCGEYSSAHDYAKLIGAPPGYVGHTDKSLLAEKAEESSAWVFLFDEIEKANPKFYDFLLSLLDDGTCTDNMGTTLDFSDSLFIFTTNQGMHGGVIGRKRVGYDKEVVSYEKNKEVILQSIKGEFPPEFLNRIDNYIFFNKLTHEQLLKVARLELQPYPVKKTKSLLEYILRNCETDEYGARNVAKYIKNNIATEVADAILNKQLPKNNANLYSFRVKNDEARISNIEEE